MSNNSATNGSNNYYLFENNSSQESQCSKKSVVTASRNKSGREKKTKNFNCEKGARVKVRRKILWYALTHHQQKVGIGDYGNSRKMYRTNMSVNGKS